jgi:hypothetical protein
MTTSQQVSFIQCVGQMSFSQMVIWSKKHFPDRHLVNTDMATQLVNYSPLLAHVGQMSVSQVVFWVKKHFPRKTFGQHRHDSTQ